MFTSNLTRFLALGVFALGLTAAQADQKILPTRTGPVSQYGMLMTGINSQNEGRVYGSCNAYSNASGNEVQVKGMSLFWSNEKSQNRFWRNDVITGMVSQQGIQVIRAAMAVDDQGWGNGHYFINGKTEYYQDLLDETVQAAIEQDIYVIIDYHSHTAVDNVGRAKEFFKIQAKKWGSYPNVIFEIYNEPICKAGQGHGNSSNCTMITWPEIKAYANEVIPIIRRYSNNLIVVGTPSWSGNPGAVVGNAITGYDNIAYTFHYYAGKDDGSDAHDFISMSADVNSAIGAGLSVFVTEWGTVGYGGDGAPSMANNPQWQTWMNLKKLSSANWNAGRNMTKDGAENSEYFADFDVDNTSPANWTYSASGEWVNANVFNGLSAMTYSQCASYVDLPAVPADDPDFDDSGDDFGDNIYEDEVISHDYVIDDFDGHNSANEYHYFFESGDKGDWTNGNGGESTFFVDGSNVGGVVGVVTGNNGWAGYGVHVETLKGCEEFSYKFRGLAHSFTIGDKVSQSVSGSGDWTTMTFDLTGIGADDLDAPFSIQWQVTGPSSGDSLLIDDVKCGNPIIPVDPNGNTQAMAYLIDDFDGNGRATYDESGNDGYDFVNKTGVWTIGNEWHQPDWCKNETCWEYEKTVYDVDRKSDVGGVWEVVSVGEDGDAHIGVHVPNLEGCAIVQYKYKGLSHKLKIYNAPSGTNYSETQVIAGVDAWTTATYDVSTATAAGLDLSSAVEIQWSVVGPANGEGFYVDDVECVTPAAPTPIVAQAYLIDDFNGKGIKSWNYVFVDEDWSIGNTQSHPSWSEDPTYMEYDRVATDPELGTVGAVLNVTSADKGAAGLGVRTPELEGCATLQYKYKGHGHALQFFNEVTQNNETINVNFVDASEYDAVDVWTTNTYDMNQAVAKGLDLSLPVSIHWYVNAPADGANFYVDDVRCVTEDEPQDNPPVVLPDPKTPTTNTELVDDFEDGDIQNLWMGGYWLETDKVDKGSSEGTFTMVKGAGGSQNALQLNVTYGTYQWTPYAAIAITDLENQNLSACQEIRYDYKGAAHKFRVKVSDDMNETLGMEYNFHMYVVSNLSESWQSVSIPLSSLRQNEEWGDYNVVPVETVMQYVNGFDWRVEQTDAGETSSSLAIDNIRCVGLAETQYYTVTFKNGEETLEEQTWAKNSNLPDPGLTPIKESTAQYSYTFGYWENFPETVTDDAVCQAHFDETLRAYTVTFLMDDGVTPVENGVVENVDYGTDVMEIVPADPSKAADAQFTYTFGGWDPAITDETIVTGDAEYTATFTTVTNKYDITFVDEDGVSVLKNAAAYDYGTTVDQIVVPVVADKDGKKFAGWIPGLATVTGNQTYTAVYTDKIVITWKDNDGSVLKTQFYDGGETPCYAGEDVDPCTDEVPAKEGDAEWSYTFAGWSPDVVAVNGDATYTASYTSTKNTYAVTFYDEDGVTELAALSNGPYAYGILVKDIAPAPTKAKTAEYTYTFAGWTPAVNDATIVKGAAEYTATYTATKNQYTITFVVDGVVEPYATVTRDYGTTVVSMFPKKDPTIEPTAQYKYEFVGWAIVNGEDVQLIDANSTMELTDDMTLTAVFDEITQTYYVTFYNYDNSVLLAATLYEYDAVVDVPEAPIKPADDEYSYIFTGWNPVVTKVTGTANYYPQYEPVPLGATTYTITFTGDADVTGIPSPTAAAEGTSIATLLASVADPTKTSTVAKDYLFAGWVVVVDDETTAPIAAGATLTGDLTLKAVFTENDREYTVTFVGEDGVTGLPDAATVEYGVKVSTLLPTTNPTKGQTAQYTYSFSKWMIVDGNTMYDWTANTTVEGDMTLMAQFTSKARTYTITFVNGDKSETKVELVYDAMPEAPEAKLPANTAQYTYSFVAWEPAIAKVTGNKTYTAKINAVLNEYKVTFLNYDNTELQSSNVKYGETPEYKGATPTKNPSATHTYTFDGWTPQVAAVTGVASYTAIFREEKIPVASSSSEVIVSSSSETIVVSSSSAAPVVSSSSVTPVVSSSSEKVVASSSSVKPASSSSVQNKSSSSTKPASSSSSIKDKPKSSSSSKTDAFYPTIAGGVKTIYANNELRISVAGTSLVKVQVFDMMGNLKESYQGVSAGEHVVSLSHLNRGNYIVRITGTGTLRNMKVSVR